MKFSKSRDSVGIKKIRSCCFGPIPALALLCMGVFVLTDCNQKQYIASESRALPKGIVSGTSDLELRPLWGASVNKKPHTNLLAMAVGMKQKENVDKIVTKFLVSSFVVMLFHYDGNVDEWRDLEWSSHALHVAASNQTKWWFAKRFLHPAVVSEYSYIFLWDDDLQVENFNVQRYLSVIKKERLEISQPVLDPKKSEINHQLFARQKGAELHRRTNKVFPGERIRNEISTERPCTGLILYSWVEMMAPVFSRASWRCVWLMIQNDFVHSRGVDFQLGYCAQGNRTKRIGIVDSDYVIHCDLAILGGAKANETDAETSSHGVEKGSSSQGAKSNSNEDDDCRNAV